MKKWMKVALLTFTCGVGAFAFSAGMSTTEAQATEECNCTVYTCPGTELVCKGHLYSFGCAWLNTHCDRPPCP